MKLKHTVIHLLSPLLIFMIGIYTATAAQLPGNAPSVAAPAAALPSVLKNSPELALMLKNWDSQSALALEMDRQAPQKVLNRTAMKGIQVNTGTGEKVALSTVYDQTFTAHAALGSQLNKIPSAALVGKLQLNEAIVEFPDSLVMVRQVRVVIRDPKQAAASAPELASFLAPVDQSSVSNATVASLPADEQEAFRRFLKEELLLLDPDDPLRQALSGGGEDAVLRAALSGAGVFDVTDEVVIERSVYNDGSLRLSAQMRPLTLQQKQTSGTKALGSAAIAKQNSAIPDSLLNRQSDREYRYEKGEKAEGSLEISESFLAGFTLGQEFKWERRWNFGCGFLRLTYTVGYGFGLRIPLRLEGALTPTRIERSAVDDSGHDLTLSLRAFALDADKDYYTAVGIPPTQLFDGQEFVLQAGATFSYKLYALGKDWVKGSLSDGAFNRSCDFTPPLGGASRELFSIDIPPEVTQTTLSANALKGYLQLGFVMLGSGTALSQATLLADNSTAAQKSLQMPNSASVTKTLRLQPLSAGSPGTVQEQKYGLRIDAPQYFLTLLPTARVRVGMAISAGRLKRSVNTDWINVVTLNLGQIKLSPHAGTRASYEWNDGVRIFETRARSGMPSEQQMKSMQKAIQQGQ
ncbi:MAG: hypothetical protein JW944_02590 [Deltaproteobacteria bacterium]|nr:hypothetical protein [Deltaproteobacteria bacterium]